MSRAHRHRTAHGVDIAQFADSLPRQAHGTFCTFGFRMVEDSHLSSNLVEIHIINLLLLSFFIVQGTERSREILEALSIKRGSQVVRGTTP